MPGAMMHAADTAQDKAADRAEAARLLAVFNAAGALTIETDILQPAEVLLDLYGEDIRSRAFITHDPHQGEMMLRPDFTVPIVQQHMTNGADPARYAYAGEVFRKQERDDTRPREYLQVGFELFDRTDPARADAEVFALFSEILSPLDLTAVTGDLGILIAAVNGLSTTPRRRAALRRHIWRPRRFRALMDRFTGRVPLSHSRQTLLSDARPAIDIANAAISVGLRSPAEVAARIDALRADAEAPLIGQRDAEVIDTILTLRAPVRAALGALRDIAVDLPAIAPATDRFEARLEALNDLGIDLSSLPFDAAFGRTSMEYYDGFVFGFSGAPNMPHVATGGRYDALTARLGGGQAIPAVGGVIRPALVRALREKLA